MAEWCWANVVSSRAADLPRFFNTGKDPTSDSRSSRSQSLKAGVPTNLSTCPLKHQPGQVDRLVSTSSDQKRATGEPTETSPIAEGGACVARAWTEALANVDPARPPADVPLRRWMQLIDDIGRFIDRGFAEKAAELGWTALDLFGCDREKPFARIDRQGLCWLIAGNRLIDLSESNAIIETRTGGRQTWHRKPSEPDRVLPWELNI